MFNGIKGQEVGVYKERLAATVSLNALSFFTSPHTQASQCTYKWLKSTASIKIQQSTWKRQQLYYSVLAAEPIPIINYFNLNATAVFYQPLLKCYLNQETSRYYRENK